MPFGCRKTGWEGVFMVMSYFIPRNRERAIWSASLAVAIGSLAMVSCGRGGASGGSGGTTSLPVPKLSLRTSSITVGPAAGTTGAAIVTSENGASVGWTATTTTTWIHLIDTSGATALLGSVARFAYDENLGATRTGTITFQNSAFSGTLTVTQTSIGYVSTLAAPKTLFTAPHLSAFAVDLAGNVYFVPDYASDTSGPLQEWAALTGNTSTLSFPASSQCPGALNAANALFVNEAATIVANRSGQCVGNTSPGPVSVTLQWTEGNSQTLVIDTGNAQIPNYWAAVTPDFKGNNFAAVSYEQGAIPTAATTSIYADGAASGLASSPIATIPLYLGTGLTGDTNGGLYLTGMSTANTAVTDYSILRIDATVGTTNLVTDLSTTITNGLAIDASGNFYFLVQDPAANNPSTYLDYYLAEWSFSTGSLTRLSATGAFSRIYGDGVGNIYAETPGLNIQEFTPVFVNIESVTEPANAGFGQLPPVIPNTTAFTAVSDSPWLTITGQGEGIVSFSFTAATTSRTAHITMLGQTITVTQQGDAPAVRFGDHPHKW